MILHTSWSFAKKYINVLKTKNPKCRRASGYKQNHFLTFSHLGYFAIFISESAIGFSGTIGSSFSLDLPADF